MALAVATWNILFAIVGACLLLIGLFGWIRNLLPGGGHEHEELGAGKTKPVVARTGMVRQLKPGVVGYRFQLPEKVHPISAGIKGGIVGGLLMPIPALIWAVSAGHRIWYPVNLLAGLVLPGLTDMPIDQLHANLEAFHPWGLLCGIVMHAIMSIGFGLIGGVLLPTLPPFFGGPILFGGIVLPLLWSGASYSLMGVVNPLLNHYIDWPWYVASQLVYGMATSIVIVRSEKISIAPRGPGGDAGGPSIPQGWLSGLLIAMVFLSGCGEGLDNLPGKPRLADALVLPQDVKDFNQLYATRCAGCHGDNGTLGPGPPLDDPMFAALVEDHELVEVIAGGRHGSLMPAWAHSFGGPLTDEQVKILASGIKERKWKTTADGDKATSLASSQAVYPSAPPLFRSGGKGNAKNGQQVYVVACENCHGENGTGTDDAGPLNNSAFLTLVSDESLRRYIITGRSDLGMPNFAETTDRPPDFKPLTADDVGNLVALFSQWRLKTEP